MLVGRAGGARVVAWASSRHREVYGCSVSRRQLGPSCPLVTVGLLAVAIALSAGLGVGGLTLLGVVLWAVVAGAVLVGAFLVWAGRPLAGAGAIVTGLSLWIAFFFSRRPGWSGPSCSLSASS